jgi:Zn-dependent protease with chaperone function
METTTTWAAEYFDGQTSRTHPADVSAGPEGLTIRIPEREAVLWPSRELHLVQGAIPGQQVHIRRKLEWVVITDAACLDAMSAVVGTPEVQPQQSRRSLWKLAIRAAVGLSMTAGVWYGWALPTGVELATPRVPVAWESVVGEVVSRRMVPFDMRVKAPREIGEIERQLAFITQEAKAPYQFRVIISKSREVNAYATPGGAIVVNRGLLWSLHGYDELLAILAHEVAHVKLRHTTRSLLHNLGLQMLMTSLTGDTTMGVLAWALGTLHHSRLSEEEADREGMKLVCAAHLDPYSMVRAYQVFDELQYGNNQLHPYFSTHPPTSDRRDQLAALAEKAPPSSRVMDSRVPWQDTQLMGGVTINEETGAILKVPDEW